MMNASGAEERLSEIGQADGTEAPPTTAVKAGEAAGADAPAELDGTEAAGADAPQAGESVGTDGQGLPSEKCTPPMVWHRFLTRFGLWVEAAVHAFQAVRMLWGGQYYTAELRARVSAELPMLRVLDGLLAIVAIVAAALCVRAALLLQKHPGAGARLLRWTYLLLLGGQLMLGAGRWCIIGLTPLSMSVLCPAALYLALLLVNGSYYKRRNRDASDR